MELFSWAVGRMLLVPSVSQAPQYTWAMLTALYRPIQWVHMADQNARGQTGSITT